MKKKVLYFLSVLVAIGALTVPAMAADFTLSSPQLKEGATLAMEQVFNGFGCQGQNVSPALAWKNPPAGVKSYAVTVYDPDAPTGSGWWHWLIFNIPSGEKGLAKNAGNPAAGLAPAGSVQGRNDFGAEGYGGACPPPGDAPHHYQFTVFALDVEKIDLDSGVSPAMVGFNLNAHMLAKDVITVRYGR